MLATCSVFAAAPLTIWIMPNGASPQEKLEQRLKIFTQKTGIPTSIQVLDWGEAWNRIAGALSTGEKAPDILQLGTTWVPYFASRGEIKPLNSWISSIDSTRFVPVSWNTSHIDADTTIYSIPWFIDIRPVLANKKILRKYNISKESLVNYEDFIAAIRKVNNAREILDDGQKVSGFAFPGKSDWNIPHNFAPWIWSNGGDFIVKDSSGHWHSSILTENTLRGIAKYLYFILDKLVPTERLQNNTAQVAQSFNNGELAFIVNTAEIVMQTRFHGAQGGLSNARIGADSVMVIPIPKGDNGSISFIGGSNLAIPQKNKRPEAIDLLLFLTSDENLNEYTRQIGFLPTSKKVLDFWAQDEDYKELVKALEYGRTYSTIPEWGDIEQSLVGMFTEVWEQLEIPAFYSEAKLYEIFKKYTQKMDEQLGYKADSQMTLEEFQKIWNRALKDASVKKADVKTEEVVQKESPLVSQIRFAPILFCIVVFIAFGVSYKRKRK